MSLGTLAFPVETVKRSSVGVIIRDEMSTWWRIETTVYGHPIAEIFSESLRLLAAVCDLVREVSGIAVRRHCHKKKLRDDAYYERLFWELSVPPGGFAPDSITEASDSLELEFIHISMLRNRQLAARLAASRDKRTAGQVNKILKRF